MLGGGVQALGHDLRDDHAQRVGGARLDEAVPVAADLDADPPGPPQLSEAGGEAVQVVLEVDGRDVGRLVQVLLHQRDRPDPLAEGLEAAAAGIRRRTAVEADQADHHLQIVAHPVVDLGQQGLLLGQRVLDVLLRVLAVGDVEAGAEKAQEPSVLHEGPRRVEQPAVDAVVPPQAELDGERRPPLEGAGDDLGVPLEILRMQPAAPAEAEFLFQGAAGELQPTLVVVDRVAVLVRPPHHQRHDVGELPEAVAQGGGLRGARRRAHPGIHRGTDVQRFDRSGPWWLTDHSVLDSL